MSDDSGTTAPPWLTYCQPSESPILPPSQTIIQVNLIQCWGGGDKGGWVEVIKWTQTLNVIVYEGKGNKKASSRGEERKPSSGMVVSSHSYSSFLFFFSRCSWNSFITQEVYSSLQNIVTTLCSTIKHWHWALLPLLKGRLNAPG